VKEGEMNTDIEALRTCLEERDLEGFLCLVSDHGPVLATQPGWTRLTQVGFPAMFGELAGAGRVTERAILTLWRCIRSGKLLVVDDAVPKVVNARLDGSMRAIEHRPARPDERLHVSEETAGAGGTRPSVPRRESARRRPDVDKPVQDQVMRRVVVASSFMVGAPSMTDTFSFKKSVCASSQERQFLQAVRQFFPNMHAYPNVALSVFIDLEALPSVARESHLAYARLARVDVLLCTPDEDPVGGIELDSRYHDAASVAERDAKKDELFRMAGIPLVRIRADEPGVVRAEDFYDLLVAETALFEELRPRRYRPRREHERLVPDELLSRIRAV
jgi:hypothetical protein